MKKYFMLLALVSSSAFAASVTLDCDLNRQIEGRQFQGQMVLTVAADNTVTGQISYSTIEAMNDLNLAAHGPIAVTGTTEHIPAGELFINATDTYQLSATLPDQTKMVVSVMPAGVQQNARLVLNATDEYNSHCVVH